MSKKFSINLRLIEIEMGWNCNYIFRLGSEFMHTIHMYVLCICAIHTLNDAERRTCMQRDMYSARQRDWVDIIYLQKKVRENSAKNTREYTQKSKKKPTTGKKNPHSAIAIFTINSIYVSLVRSIATRARFFPSDCCCYLALVHIPYFVSCVLLFARALTHFIHASFYFHSV